jgi:hypothetical protein
MSDSQASDSTDANNERTGVSAETLATAGTDWEHKRRGVPTSWVDGVPDDATTWASLERTANRGLPITLTIYQTTTGEAFLVVAIDDEREVFERFDDVNAAAADAEDRMDEYGPSE